MRVVTLAPLALLLAACTSSCHPGDAARAESPRARTNVSASTVAGTASARRWTKPPGEELKRTLSPIAWNVTQENGTEPPFQNTFFDHHEAGIYVDVTTGEPLFASTDKFESGTGWPSFTRPIDEAHVTRLTDATHGMTRVEARSRAGDAHLGHVFDDGPQPTGERWCINSASLRFVPVDRLEAEGHAGFLPRFGRTAKIETAILAGGCFWGMEELLRKIPGVVSTEVGYEGGAEAVKVMFRPGELAYATLLEDWYFRMHDPTTKDRQGNDTGAQYRSAIFFTTEAQRVTAEEVKAKVGKAGRWKGPIVTQVAPATGWKVGEEDHQDYLQKHPDGYTCHYLRDWL